MFNKICRWFAPVGLLGCLLPFPAIAQIHPAVNATNTTVTVNGQQFDIGGGAFSRDGKNLFHLFRQFGLNDGQIANFLSKPNVQNILAGVNGGDVSYINGLIQVMGGNSNLYLLNPAGIVFGPNASLNVPAAFHASTAQRVHFDGGIFDINGFNDYANLVGNPTGFEFLSTGIIVNEGNLAVGPGQNLTLMGHQVFNTGTLSAPGGTITIQAVPETGMVRISQEGMILSLEIPADRIPEDGVIEAVDLPRLITGGEDRPRVNSVVHNPDGSINLVHDPSKVNVPVDGATAVASGTLDVSNLEGLGGQINVLGSNVAFINAQLNAQGITGGGTILGGGDYLGGSADTGRLDSSFNAQNLFVDNNTVMNADAVTQGNGGTVINWADNSTVFQGMISARGGELGGDGGFVEVSGKKYLHFDGQVNTLAPQGQAGMLLLDPQDLTISTGANSGVPVPFNPPEVLFTFNGMNDSVLNTATLNAVTVTTNVTLQATRDIRFNNPVSLANPGVSLTAQAGRDIYLDADITTNGGDVSLLAGPASGYGTADANGMIRRTVAAARTIQTNGGDIVLNAATIDLPNRNLNTSNGSHDAGSITVTSTVGGVTLNALTAGASLAGATAGDVGNGGAVTVNSAGAITTGAITANSSRTGAGVGNAGNAAPVNLTAQGNVTTGVISTNSQRTQDGAGDAGDAGNLTITTQTGNIQVGAINANSNRANAGIGDAGLGGIISLTTANGNIITQAINTSSASATGAANNGGAISLTTQTSGNITLQSGSQNVDARGTTGGGITINAAGNFTYRSTNSGNVQTNNADLQLIAGGNLSIATSNFGNLQFLTTNGNIFINSGQDTEILGGGAGNNGWTRVRATNGNISLDVKGNLLLRAGNNGDSFVEVLTATSGNMIINVDGNLNLLAGTAAGGGSRRADLVSVGTQTVTVGQNIAVIGGGNVNANARIDSALAQGITAGGTIEVRSNNGANFGRILSSSTSQITAENTLTVATDGLLQSGGDLTLVANDMALDDGLVNAGTHRVTLRPFTDGREIDLGTETAGKLSLVSDELNNITAGILQIGDANSGSIQISAPLSPTNTNTLQLVTGQGISQTAGANLAIANLGLIAQGNVDLESSGNAIGTLALNITGNNHEFKFNNTQNYVIGAVAGNSGLNLANGTIVLSIENNNTVTQTQPVIAQGLAFSGTGSFTFDHTGNTVQTFASDATGDIEFINSGTLIIGQVNPTGVTGANSVNIRTQSGNLILNQPVQAQNSITLVTPNNFINNFGSGAIQSTGDRWLVYSFSPSSNVNGGLVGAEQFNTAYPGAATFAGNGFLYQINPSQLNPNTVLPDPSSPESTSISSTPTPSSTSSSTLSTPVTSTSSQVDIIPDDPDTNGPSDIATILQGQESASNFDEEVLCNLDSEAASATFNDLTPEQWAKMHDSFDCLSPDMNMN
ncbi:filamentous hemagglutinin N-terminal domain-containing protein [Candidatus Synechococcus calcipolaris G9]|uniref:Filamentous hemagglutinin N-terminal domain-containing protein n=1 Tax=Candidatus Synechococcus calcipolaris G9 TaxID=1497997 RepID=A0ABT6EVN3_9SYNE|nr:filamentous hemagglutinin N-terminal domain-containing protein [Candidatus Synechococcus calcipolaris]MDG2989843.1 filamentous hemagglutinin N-terminal domain-containing protein [Candidatus Synechococcus calcipolaris G9]